MSGPPRDQATNCYQQLPSSLLKSTLTHRFRSLNSLHKQLSCPTLLLDICSSTIPVIGNTSLTIQARNRLQKHKSPHLLRAVVPWIRPAVMSTAEKVLLTRVVRQQRAYSCKIWVAVSSTLKQYGYSRTAVACIRCWDHMGKEAQKVRAASTTPGGTQMLPSVTINIPYPDKWVLHLGTDQNSSRYHS